MVYDPTQADAFRRRLLESPGERQEAEYKSSVPFDGESDFSLKLLKHIQGMVNGGGGSIVIGFTEGGNKPYEPDPKHTNEIARSYDTTNLSEAANASVFGDQPIKLSVHHTELESTGLIYPIIAVQQFERQPVVCCSGRNKILRPGAVYVRRPSASTSEARTLQDWEELIDLCVELRHNDLLERFGALLDAKTGKTPAPQQDALESLDEWTNKIRERAFGRE